MYRDDFGSFQDWWKYTHGKRDIIEVRKMRWNLWYKCNTAIITVIILIPYKLYFYFSWICLLYISIIKIVYIDYLNHTLLDEILESKNVNLSHLLSLANLQFWTFGLHPLYVWIQFVQASICNIFGKLYCTYLFFTLGTCTYTSKLYCFHSLSLVQQCFLQLSYSFSLYLHWLFALMVYSFAIYAY